MQLTHLGSKIWNDRYALKDDNGETVEKEIVESFRRSAKAMSSKEIQKEIWEERFFEIMSNGFFCPAGRILAHSGTHYSQLLNCFVIPFEDDSLESIMTTAKNMAIVQKFGGGTGFNYSTLRPSGSYIKGVNGRSCGVLGFLHMMSTTSEVIEQGGSRRGASIGILEVSHPDIWEFISYKTNHNWDRLLEFMSVKDEERWEYFKYENLYKLQMYNISVGVTDDFFAALEKDEFWPLMWKDKEWELYKIVFKKNIKGEIREKEFEIVADSEQTAFWKVKKFVPYPRPSDTFEVVSKRKIKASEIWQKICHNAWADGCPGLINMSTARKMHNLEYCSPLIGTNPCGEQLLSGYSSCNLSSLILSAFVINGEFNFNKFKEAIIAAVRFCDNVIDNCTFPLVEIERKAKAERRVGLGTMGVHDMLIKMKLDYDSEEGRKVVEQVLEFFRDESYKAAIELAKEKGSFPLFDADKFCSSGFIRTLPNDIVKDIMTYGIRCGTLISQAPTGTIGTMLNVSTGCEPWFALSIERNTKLGSYEDGCPEYIKWKKLNEKEIPSYFKTAEQIKPEDHVKMLLLFSKYIDSSVSKTVNLPETATVEEIKSVFLMAMKNGSKGITIFRDGSKQAVLVNKDKNVKEKLQENKQTDRASIKRGSRTVGATYRIHMQNHNIYVIANKNNQGNLVEIFATVGESKKPNVHHTSGVEDSWAEGVAKIISLALRAGVDPHSIIRNLKNIPSDKPVFTTIGDNEMSELISSPPHAIARVMEEELKYDYMGYKKTVEDLSNKKGFCKECFTTNITWRSSTCYDCHDCGHSGCQG